MTAKVFSLIIVLLALSYLSTAKKCISTPKSCAIEYESYAAPPVCTTYIDEQGKEQQQCYAIGTALAMSVLDKTTSSMSASMGISKITFSGDCKCTFTLWAQSNFKGASKSHTLKDGESSFMTSSVWNKENASFGVVCKF